MSQKRRRHRPTPLEWSTSAASGSSDCTESDLCSIVSRSTATGSSPVPSPSPASSRPTSPCVSPRGKLAYLASRRSSRDSQCTTATGGEGSPIASPRASYRLRQRRQSNFLELPVVDHVRPRVCSLPEGGYNPRSGVGDDIYRLRTFSITNKGVVNCGDSLIPRRSRSNTSMASTNSSHSLNQSWQKARLLLNNRAKWERWDSSNLYPRWNHYSCPYRHSNLSGERSPFDGSCCGSSAVSSDSEQSVAEKLAKFRVVLLGHSGVGKSALVSQFMTSEYINTYDVSLGKVKV
ncbi:unnamed protein product [Allacma fusca]|uniref:Uncharacterized protein n=1 Tax=Allacma fusca TaxID=39272 RepID=A0A8J2LJJ1_9HEXA|nr:unnamed protein product [Allacma fusca]